MINVKDAIKAAMLFVAETFNTGTSTDPIASMRLEEVEPSDDGRHWFITISLVRGIGPGALGAMLGSRSESALECRDYKTVTVDAETGLVKSVKIRQLT
jgi:hypothetical protein